MRALATLVDAAAFVRSKLGSSAEVSLVVAEEQGGVDEQVPKKFLFDRWIPTTLTLTATTAEASNAAMPLIDRNHKPGSSGSKSRHFTLSLSQGSKPATLVLPCSMNNEEMCIERIGYWRS